jgi:thiol:disulfide interchange protein DsbD
MCAGSSTSREAPHRSSERCGSWPWLGAWILLFAPVAAWGVGQAELLPAERAFELSVAARDGRTVAARFAVAEGYYLYRDRMEFALADATLAAAPELPRGKVKDDPFFGRVEILRGEVVVELKLAHDRGGDTVKVVVTSQGCADAGVCYPAQRQTVAVPLPKPGERPGAPVEAAPRRKSWFN